MNVIVGEDTQKLYEKIVKKRDEKKPEVQLPVKKWNSPIGRVVCWRCRRYNIPLKRLRNAKGVKTPDYACNEHYTLGLPPIGNVSINRFQYAEKK